MTDSEKLDRITKINNLNSYTIEEPAEGYEMLKGYTIQCAVPDYVYNIGQQSKLVGFTLTLEKGGHLEMQTFRFPKD